MYYCIIGDNKISHKNPEVVKNVISELEIHFGKLTVESGNKFNFLGMDINITKERKIEISMKKQIEQAWNGMVKISLINQHLWRIEIFSRRMIILNS